MTEHAQHPDPRMLLGMTTSPYRPPPIDTATDPVYSAADLCQRWRALMGPLGFGGTLLWLGFVGADRRMYKTLSQVPVDPAPTPRIVFDIMSRLGNVVDNLEAGTTVALLLTRPGSDSVSDADRRWVKALTATAARLEVPLQPFFRANDISLVQVKPGET